VIPAFAPVEALMKLSFDNDNKRGDDRDSGGDRAPAVAAPVAATAVRTTATTAAVMIVAAAEVAATAMTEVAMIAARRPVAVAAVATAVMTAATMIAAVIVMLRAVRLPVVAATRTWTTRFLFERDLLTRMRCGEFY